MLPRDTSTFFSLNLLEPNPCLGIGNLFLQQSLNPQEEECPTMPVQFPMVLSGDSKKLQFLKYNQILFSIKCHQIT